MDNTPYDHQPTRSISQQGIALPNHTMQNQIHELAKTLPPPRKQNTACDACRARKVKCNRIPGQDKCQHCISKNYPCTHYSQQATSEKKRSAAGQRRPKPVGSGHSAHSGSPTPGTSKPGSPTNFPSSPASQSSSIGITTHTPSRQVLAYLFAPPDNSSELRGHYRSAQPSYSDWGEQAIRLEDDAFRVEFALDLVEVYFQIVHTRLPLLNPVQFRHRIKVCLAPTSSPSSSPSPLHPALIATVIAWGAKFSEHPLLVADRKRGNGRSNFARDLIARARELAESMKVHRVPNPDHVVVALLIEPLQSQTPDDPNGFQGFWLSSAIRLLLGLQINHKSVMATIQDPEARGTMIFAWWMACLSDAYASCYYRRKPQLDDDDYDIDFYTADPTPPELGDSHSPAPSPREQYEFLGYYRASHALARISRQISRQFWRPITESDGIPCDVLCQFISLLSEWRDQYLLKVGIPSNFQAEWDFVSAVSACGSDATYHTMWVVMFNAVDDFGIKEVNEVLRMGGSPTSLPNHLQIEVAKKKLMEEALHGSSRISGLAGVLTSNGYLRLDPAVMHISIIQAGMLLARLGRPEVNNCIAGLDQYSAAYDEAADNAAEMRRIYATARSGESDLNHMASVTPRVLGFDHSNNGGGGQPMNIDQPPSHYESNGNGNGSGGHYR
ncbi:hypothetical protein JAAARDRAFT_465069 [Jaapia argillacea MUCL 33604]|uniref:Zn(2)-C6 fungal-type domain-containing protein n=1 Tax=Jaapia argillacea MUCL 33604 TaxID=933084 RepID=A0A067Q8T3_9AGAM|nr:hypothetical protein JAAARDRAFT_465069 [Jaapia argillacea MUCL 33604]